MGGRIDAVLFDLDGTLVDSIADLALAANAMLRELGRAERELDEIRSFVGKGIPNLVSRCLPDVAPQGDAFEAAVAVFKRHYAAVNGQRSRPYPGVVAMLDALAAQRLPMACVTNKAAAFTEPLLAQLGLMHYFGSIVSGDTLEHKKPHPAMLEHACAELGVGVGRALMVGDSANDALSARAAGCPVLLFTWGYSEGRPVDTIDCDGLLSSASALVDWLAARSH